MVNDDGRLSTRRFTALLNDRHVAMPDAQMLLAAAKVQAKAESKRLLVQVSGAQCHPCVLLSRYLNDYKDLIAKDYIYVKLDSRMKNGARAIRDVRRGDESSIPWMSILAADGAQLATSDHKDKGNIGFPSSQTGRAHFAEMLDSTRVNLSEAEVDKLLAGLAP